MALTPYYLSDDTIDTHNPNWMKDIDDYVLLSQISIPGTHETMAKNPWGHDILPGNNFMGVCQSLSLSAQLNAGIRYIDIRCYYESSKSDAGISAPSFSIHHEVINENKALGADVLSVVASFLQNNPSETILMRIKQEKTKESDTTFSNTFQKYVDQYKSYFWDSNNQTSIPKLGEVRGKIVVLYDIGDHKFGLPYSDPRLFCTQDNYSFSTNWHQYTKWEEVKTHLTQADEQYQSNQEDPQNNILKSAIFLNYLSGNVGSYPFFVASGHVAPGTNGGRLWTGLTTLTSKHKWPDFPRLNGFLGLYSIYFEGINNLCGDRLEDYRYVGIVAADFPGAGLIEKIIEINKTHPPQILKVAPPESMTISKTYQLSDNEGQKVLWNNTDFNQNPQGIFIEFNNSGIDSELMFLKDGTTVSSFSTNIDVISHKILTLEFDTIVVNLPNNSKSSSGTISATLYYYKSPWASTSKTDTIPISSSFTFNNKTELWYNNILSPAKGLRMTGSILYENQPKSDFFPLQIQLLKDEKLVETLVPYVLTPSQHKADEPIDFIVCSDQEFDQMIVWKLIALGFSDDIGDLTLNYSGEISYIPMEYSNTVFKKIHELTTTPQVLWKNTLPGKLGEYVTINGFRNIMNNWSFNPASSLETGGIAMKFLKSGKEIITLNDILSIQNPKRNERYSKIYNDNYISLHVPEGFDEIQVSTFMNADSLLMYEELTGKVFLNDEGVFSSPNPSLYINKEYNTPNTTILWEAPLNNQNQIQMGNQAHFFIENTPEPTKLQFQFIKNEQIIYSVENIIEVEGNPPQITNEIIVIPTNVSNGFDTIQFTPIDPTFNGLIVGSVEVLSPSQNTVNETKIENSLSLSEKSKSIFYTSKELEQITALTQKLFISVKEDILANDVTDYQINQVALKIDGLSAENFLVEKQQLERKIQQAKRLSQRRNLLQYGNFESTEPWIFSSHATILDSNDLFPQPFLTLTSTLTPDKNPTYAYQQIPKNRLKPYTRYIVRGFIAKSTELDILLSCDSTIIKQQLNVPTAKVQQISIENGNCCAQAGCIYADGTVTDSHWFTYTIDTGSLQQNSDVGLELCFKLTTEKGNAQIGNVEIIEERLLTEKEKQKKQQKEKKWAKQKQIKMRKMRKTLDIMHEDIASLYDMKMNLKLDVSHKDIQNVHIPHANSLEGVYLSMVPDQPGPYYEEYQLLASLKRYARRVYRNRNKISNGTFQYNLLDWKYTGNVDVQIEKKHSVLQLLDSGAMVSQLVQLPIENVKGEEISYLLRIHAQGNGKVTILHGEEVTVLPFTNSDEQVQMIEWYPSTNEVQLEISSKSGKVTVSSIEILEKPDVE
ncbi:phosphatidylinositol-specific phospholipase C domain-containing protein [Bacillus sp. FSL W7-1294]|uniref:phosphatidylinositol-specific phospholipase C domain-containing protein n=1 Tax=Bacillus TaxID=1386 RepID=UPI00077A57AA|nr:phosphatidylinositol-specific phospholipase C domain-containing protein [Bacillus cereus]KXY85247.1 hypothetical protein AT270_09435 [Bacillus cereus]